MELAKLVLKDAYRIIPVHPLDYHLIDISWREKVFVDSALLFGLRSVPKLFSAVLDLISWVLYQHGIEHQLHYLDDFLFTAPPSNTGVAEWVLAMSI